MARKNILRFQLAEQKSLATSFTTAATFCKTLDNISYQIDIQTTDSDGTFAIEASNDYDVNESNVVTNTGTWVPLVLAGTPTVAHADDTILISLNQVPFTALRLVYTSSVAGTGKCDITVVAKQIGG